MACGCQGGANAEQFEVVFADNTVSAPMPKTDALAMLSASGGGGYIRPQQVSGPVEATASR